jgi:hypothetical protein
VFSFPLEQYAPQILPSLGIPKFPKKTRSRYGALATHVACYELAADGPLLEHHLVGPLDTLDESAWRTEIGWPIMKVAERPHPQKSTRVPIA